MAVNKSVEAFKRLTTELKRDVLTNSVAELNAQADGLIDLMRQVVPVRTGALKGTIHKEPGKKETVVVIKAGGASTTKEYVRGRGTYEREVRLGSGDTAGIKRVKSGGFGITYDYARAVEFGAKDRPAHPFFFPSFRLKRGKMRRTMKSRITKIIKQYSAA